MAPSESLAGGIIFKLQTSHPHLGVIGNQRVSLPLRVPARQRRDSMGRSDGPVAPVSNSPGADITPFEPPPSLRGPSSDLGIYCEPSPCSTSSPTMSFLTPLRTPAAADRAIFQRGTNKYNKINNGVAHEFHAREGPGQVADVRGQEAERRGGPVGPVRGGRGGRGAAGECIF